MVSGAFSIKEVQSISIQVLVVLLCVSTVILTKAWVSKHPCIKSHTEIYYSSEGTALSVATKNYGFLGMNGYKTREVCDERK